MRILDKLFGRKKADVSRMIIFFVAFVAALQSGLVLGQVATRNTQPPPPTDCKSLGSTDVVVIRLAASERRQIFEGSVEHTQIYRILSLDATIGIGLDRFGPPSGQDSKPSKTLTLEPLKVIDVASWTIELTAPQPTTVCYVRIGAASGK